MKVFYYWQDRNKPLANVSLILGLKNVDWFDYLAFYSILEYVGANRRSLN